MGESLLGRLFSRGRKAPDDAPTGQGAPAPSHVRCQVCGSLAPLLDTVDFNKSCEELRGKRLPPSGTPVRYHFCLNCGFCFAPEIQAWSREQFAASIYNDDYQSVDPEYVRDRPLSNARMVEDVFGGSKQQLRHLDYGGGSGLMSATLRAQGWDSTSYDPFADPETKVEDLGTYDLVTAFEVFEHVPDVQVLLDDLGRLCRPDGAILFTTLLSDRELALGRKLTWWYAAPRNGHISLFSRASLTRWMAGKALRVASLSDSTHMACHSTPPWAAHLVVQG